VLHSRALFDDAQGVTAGYGRARLDRWRKRPTGLRVQRGHGHSRGYEVARSIREPLERASDSIDDRAQQARSELGHQGASSPTHRFVKPEPAGLFEDLDRRHVVLDPNHLAQQTQLTHFHELIERGITQRLCLRDRARHSDDACLGHWSFTRYPMARRRISTMYSCAVVSVVQSGPGTGMTTGSADRRRSRLTSSGRSS